VSGVPLRDLLEVYEARDLMRLQYLVDERDRQLSGRAKAFGED